MFRVSYQRVEKIFNEKVDSEEKSPGLQKEMSAWSTSKVEKRKKQERNKWVINNLANALEMNFSQGIFYVFIPFFLP